MRKMLVQSKIQNEVLVENLNLTRSWSALKIKMWKGASLSFRAKSESYLVWIKC